MVFAGGEIKCSQTLHPRQTDRAPQTRSPRSIASNMLPKAVNAIFTAEWTQTHTDTHREHIIISQTRQAEEVELIIYDSAQVY